MLHFNSMLVTLDVASNNIGPEGARLIATALRTNSTLTHLNLRDNDIGDDGAVALLNSMKRNESVTRMIVKRNNIRPGIKQSLIAAVRRNMEPVIAQFHGALTIGCVEIVTKCLSQGVDVLQQVDGEEVLLFALRKKHLNCVLALLQSEHGPALLLRQESAGTVARDVARKLSKMARSAAWQ